jgi:hypothetical protein
MPELELAAKAAGVHRVATKNIASLIPAIDDVLRSRRSGLISPSEWTNQARADLPKEKLD